MARTKQRARQAVVSSFGPPPKQNGGHTSIDFARFRHNVLTTPQGHEYDHLPCLGRGFNHYCDERVDENEINGVVESLREAFQAFGVERPEEWSAEAVFSWLERQNAALGVYRKAWLALGLNADLFVSLTDQDLCEEVGVVLKLHREKILKCAQRFKALVDHPPAVLSASRTDGVWDKETWALCGASGPSWCPESFAEHALPRDELKNCHVDVFTPIVPKRLLPAEFLSAEAEERHRRIVATRKRVAKESGEEEEEDEEKEEVTPVAGVHMKFTLRPSVLVSALDAALASRAFPLALVSLVTSFLPRPRMEVYTLENYDLALIDLGHLNAALAVGTVGAHPFIRSALLDYDNSDGSGPSCFNKMAFTATATGVFETAMKFVREFCHGGYH